MGMVVKFPPRRQQPRRYDAAALDRLLAEIERRGGRRRAAQRTTRSALVLAFPSPER